MQGFKVFASYFRAETKAVETKGRKRSEKNEKNNNNETQLN